MENGALDQTLLEQIFEELKDWEGQLKHADINWDAVAELEDLQP
ncbi:MAG: hypothetical protein AAF862_05245 [Pseudomonadota bacterium]